MSHQDVRPKWWLLYLTGPLLIILFAVDSRLKLSARGHQVAQIGIVLFIYGLIYIWLKANRSAFLRMDRRRSTGSIRVIQIFPEQSLDSEIKGQLSDAFEMNYVDAEFPPMEEVSQEIQKE